MTAVDDGPHRRLETAATATGDDIATVANKGLQLAAGDGAATAASRGPRRRPEA
jgi:hypothetical protein